MAIMNKQTISIRHLCDKPGEVSMKHKMGCIDIISFESPDRAYIAFLIE